MIKPRRKHGKSNIELKPKLDGTGLERRSNSRIGVAREPPAVTGCVQTRRNHGVVRPRTVDHMGQASSISNLVNVTIGHCTHEGKCVTRFWPPGRGENHGVRASVVPLSGARLRPQVLHFTLRRRSRGGRGPRRRAWCLRSVCCGSCSCRHRWWESTPASGTAVSTRAIAWPARSSRPWCSSSAGSDSCSTHSRGLHSRALHHDDIRGRPSRSGLRGTRCQLLDATAQEAQLGFILSKLARAFVAAARFRCAAQAAQNIGPCGVPAVIMGERLRKLF